MKKALILAIALFLSRFANAQSIPAEDTPETLFKGSVVRSSGYGALVTKFSSFNDEFGVLVGAYGGWFANDKFMIGLGGYGLASSITVPEAFNRYPGKRSSWAMGYGGLMLEYTLQSKKLFHASFNTLIGAGGVGKNVHGINNNNQDWRDETYDGSAFFALEPGINVEVNLTRWFRIGVGGSYRYVKGSSTSGISDSDMSAPSANVSLKFGGF